MVTVSFLLIVSSFFLSAAFLVTGIYQEVDASSKNATTRQKVMNYTDDGRAPAFAFCFLSSLLQIAYGILVLLHTKKFVLKMRALIFWVWIAVYGVCTALSLASFAFAYQIEVGFQRPDPTNFPYPLRDAFVVMAAAHWMFSFALFLLGLVLKKGKMAEFHMGIKCIKSEEGNEDEEQEEEEEPSGNKMKEICSWGKKRNPHACEHLIICYSIAFGLVFLTVAWMAIVTSSGYEVVLEKLENKSKNQAIKGKWTAIMKIRNIPVRQNFYMGLIPGCMQAIYSVIVFIVQRGWPCWFLFIPVHIASSVVSSWVFYEYHHNHSDENPFQSLPYFDDRELAFPSMALVNTIFCACACIIYIIVFVSRHVNKVVEKIRRASKGSGASGGSASSGSGKCKSFKAKCKKFLVKCKNFLVKVRDRPWHLAVRIVSFILLGVLVGVIIFIYICLTTRVERFKYDALRMHNLVRARHEDTPPLVMSRGLSIMARRCGWYYTDANQMKHECPWKFGAGECLVGGGSKGHNDTDEEKRTILVGAAYNMWRNELPLYASFPLNASRKSINDDTKGTYHFTQIIWRNSSKFGPDVEIGGKVFRGVYFYHPGGNQVFYSEMNANIRGLKPEFEMCHDKRTKWSKCPGDGIKGVSLNINFDIENATFIIENYNNYKMHIKLKGNDKGNNTKTDNKNDKTSNTDDKSNNSKNGTKNDTKTDTNSKTDDKKDDKKSNSTG